MRSIVLFFLVSLSTFSFAQKKEKPKPILLKGAKSLENGTYKNREVTWLKGNARFEHDGVRMRCDSAFQFEGENSLDAFGHIRIKQGDTLLLTGDSLSYNGDSSRAIIRGNVRLKDTRMTLTSKFLDYRIKDRMVFYTEGGRIVDHENTLTSKEGYYDMRQKTYFFKDSVRLIRDSSLVSTDTLKYAVDTNVAYFLGPTTITGKDKRLFAMDGQYNTNHETSYIKDSAWIDTKEYYLKGDSLYFDNKTDYGAGFGHVFMHSKKDSSVVLGDVAYRNREPFLSEVFGNVNSLRILNGDTIFLRSDTLISINDTLKNIDLTRAFHNVLLYRTNFQGICDSLVYNITDSVIYMYTNPVVWKDKNQISGDSIRALLNNDGLYRVYIRQKAFVISQDTIFNFNQIKGRNMTAYFHKGTISHIDVDGNGQSNYFALQEETKLIGMNAVECSNMIIKFKDSELSDISFLTKPDAQFIPPKYLNNSNTKLKNFNWRQGARPKREYFFIERSPQEEIWLNETEFKEENQ